MHGGARGSGAQPGNRNAWVHGLDSAEWRAQKRALRELLRDCRQGLRLG
jgi:ribosomal protein L19E